LDVKFGVRRGKGGKVTGKGGVNVLMWECANGGIHLHSVSTFVSLPPSYHCGGQAGGQAGGQVC